MRVKCTTCKAPLQRSPSELKRIKRPFCNNECKWQNNPPKRVPNLKGLYWNLEVLQFSHMAGKKRHYKYKCICGNEGVAEHYNIKSGRTSSCGCCRSLAPRTKTNYQAYIKRWEALEGLAKNKPNLKYVLEGLAKEYPVYV